MGPGRLPVDRQETHPTTVDGGCRANRFTQRNGRASGSSGGTEAQRVAVSKATKVRPPGSCCRTASGSRTAERIRVRSPLSVHRLLAALVSIATVLAHRGHARRLQHARGDSRSIVRRATAFDAQRHRRPDRSRVFLWASSIGVDASVTSLHPPGNSEAGATKHRDSVPTGATATPPLRHDKEQFA